MGGPAAGAAQGRARAAGAMLIAHLLKRKPVLSAVQVDEIYGHLRELLVDRVKSERVIRVRRGTGVRTERGRAAAFAPGVHSAHKR